MASLILLTFSLWWQDGCHTCSLRWLKTAREVGVGHDGGANRQGLPQTLTGQKVITEIWNASYFYSIPHF